jgi:putative membrane protein
MKKHILLVLLFFVGLIVSAIQPKEYFTWFLEVFPAILGFIIICFTYKKFHFANFTYFLILIHCYILFIGGHYTYAEVPLFNWIREIFDQSRNNYDKLGHFAQGFIPAAIIREIFIRKNVLNKLNWLPFITISICLAISAFYELIEWLISILTKEEGDSFLGTQGYIWDTQSDMLFALIGAITMVVFLSKFQDKQIKNINLETLSS